MFNVQLSGKDFLTKIKPGHLMVQTQQGAINELCKRDLDQGTRQRYCPGKNCTVSQFVLLKKTQQQKQINNWVIINFIYPNLKK